MYVLRSAEYLELSANAAAGLRARGLRAGDRLAVVTPDQDVLCNMNAAGGNLNPVLDIPAPIEGAYKVYVAAMQPNTVVAGRLTITGDTKAAPATLAPAK